MHPLVHLSFVACGIILLPIVVAVVTTSDVVLFSCREGDLAVVRVLIEEYKVNPECTDKNGHAVSTSLCLQVCTDSPEIISAGTTASVQSWYMQKVFMQVLGPINGDGDD